MADGRRRLGNGISVQGNVDLAYLFSPLPVLTDEIYRVVKSTCPKGHILNLGHSVLVKTMEEAVAHFFDVMRSVLVKTMEEAVAHFFDVMRSVRYDTLFQGYVTEELQPVA